MAAVWSGRWQLSFRAQTKIRVCRPAPLGKTRNLLTQGRGLGFLPRLLFSRNRPCSIVLTFSLLLS